VKRLSFLAGKQQKALTILLFIAVVFQVVYIGVTFVTRMPARIRSVADLPALERGARLSFGDNFAEFITFLREAVPDDATLVVPPMGEDDVYGNSALVAYFLFPRAVLGCNGGESFEACAGRFGGDSYYWLSTSNYHPVETQGLSREWTPFEGEKGIYAP